MLPTTPNASSNPLRNNITKAYRMDETECLNLLIPKASLSEKGVQHIEETAKSLMQEARAYKKRASKIDTLLHQYDLSTEEGIALMCLAEALLRIPDKATVDKFISDKLSTVQWKNHLDRDNSFFVNAATWSLILTGKVYAPTLDEEKNLFSSLKRGASRVGATMIRPFIMQMMKAIGNQFVIGEDIESALTRAQKLESQGYRFSYDMLGEAARTEADADFYYQSYLTAINAIGKVAKSDKPEENPGISIKLSALHPRYDYTQYERVMQELPPRLLTLAELAKKYRIGLTIDAEEADRLDLSLDIFEKIFTDPALKDWDGLGLALQAYQKRASFVIDWLVDLSTRAQKRIMVRLVKGAYWDAEIKMTQLLGLNDYPVFTRKNSTDVSYLACAKKLLAHPECFFAQFGTHNAYSAAAILEMTGERTDFEFQGLQGMCRPLYDQIVDKSQYNRPCRIYAPVGTHKDLLGYLVRRLLENGANSSFVNKLSNDDIPIEKIVIDPVKRVQNLAQKRHPRIPLPKDIYGEWENSEGIDLSNRDQQQALLKHLEKSAQDKWFACSIVNGELSKNKSTTNVKSPANQNRTIGVVSDATPDEIETALHTAKSYAKTWGETSVESRAAILEKAASLLQQEMPTLIAYLNQEGGKCIPDCISEIRETIDYCRYYAYRARHDLKPTLLPGPTGEMNQLTLHPRGVVVCISPWNFPIAIFTGQIVAALVTGNTVIAKPAEQTPLVAFKTVQLLHEAGIPKEALQLLIGPGDKVGAKVVSDPRIAGVMFTGSTETAKAIERSLANREGPIAFLIAETGGQNAMIVDSSALAEQAVIDIAQSAFNSAGQRCSALRVLFVQEEIAPKLIDMLKGYMQELQMGTPQLLVTDIGPVIDEDAHQMLMKHFAKMENEATLLAQVPMHDQPNGHYFAPSLFELPNLSLLKREVFGPILHVIKYRGDELNSVLKQIVATGYGLTLGVHSRIDATIDAITDEMPVGNMYVNRNIIGAVVGVQPFGGERLSGTGPKAGGPHYLPRLCVERTISVNTTAVGGNARLVSLMEEDE